MGVQAHRSMGTRRAATAPRRRRPALVGCAPAIERLQCGVPALIRIGLPSSARIFERYWNEHISAFLEREELLVGTQNGRAEWRSVHKSILKDPAQKKLRELVERLASDISKMARALS